MFDDLRRPPFLVAVFCLVFAYALEAGAGWAAGAISGSDLPGYGVGAIALVDVLLALSVGLMAASLFISHAVYGRVHAVVSLIVGFGVLVKCMTSFFSILVQLMLMIGLLTSFFGIPVYFARYADFDVDTASLFLTLTLVLKQAAAILLIVANQRFLGSKSLVLLVLTSMVATLVVSLLHAWVPGFLVSITDAIAALIVIVLAGLWSISTIGGSLVGLSRAVRSLT